MKANEIIAKAIKVVDELNKKGKQLSVLLLSRAGMGKTTTVRLYCETHDYNLVTIIPSQNAADDILGIQVVDHEKGRMKRLTPSWFNSMVDLMKNGKRTLLFIDEISTCDPYIQGPLLDLIFSRSLGEAKLPNNAFIIAAGNYSSDLNNEFRMSAPLVNRFVLVNLRQEDYNISEILNGGLDKLKNREDKLAYMGLEDAGKGNTYDFRKLVQWIRKSKEITYGKTSAEEDESLGLLGFTSVRSISYSLMFAEEYMSIFNDNNWIRIIGDTLGSSNKRETNSKNGIPLCNVIKTYEDRFVKDEESANEDETIASICDRITKCGYNAADIQKISKYLDTHNADEITSEDFTAFTNLSNILSAEDLKDNDDIIDICSKFLNKVSGSNSAT